MKKEKMLHMYVYRMILTDIYNEKYQFEEKISTLSQLCTKYQVGRNTVRSALTQLKEDGYVTMQKGVQTTVCFNIHNFASQEHYRQAVRDSEKMVIEVFETVELIFPDIVANCLSIATPEQMEQLKDMIEKFSSKTIKNERDIIQELYKIYLYTFSFLNNPILNDLFITLMYSIHQPIISHKKVHSLFKSNMKAIQEALNMLLKFSKMNNQVMVKNVIVTMCKSNSKLSKKYLDELCEGLEIQKNIEFTWVANRENDYLYAKVVLEVLNNIYRHVYQRGMILPSILGLSRQYDVSEKTARKALDVLRDYQVIETINGIGSKVIIDDKIDWNQVFKNPSLNQNIKEYYYSCQLLSIILQPSMNKVFKETSPKKFIEFYQLIMNQKSFSLEIIYDYTFSQCNQCLQTIYGELKKSLNWSVFVDRIIDYSQYDFVSIKHKLLLALKDGDVSQICSLSNQTIEIILDSLYPLIQ